MVEVCCRWTLKPRPMAQGSGSGGSSGGQEGAGVSEVGGTHWLASSAMAAAAAMGPSGGQDAGDGAEGQPLGSALAGEHEVEGGTGGTTEGQALVLVTYRVRPGGLVGMDWTIDATGCLPATLPPGLHR